MMKIRVNYLNIFFVIFLMNNFFANCQKIGDTKKMTLRLNGIDNDSQIGGFLFTNSDSGEDFNLSMNDFVLTSNIYKGIPIDSMENYIGSELDIEFIYIVHLCNEGVFDFACQGWVVTNLNLSGAIVKPRNLVIPVVGEIVDPDGYVNVRSEMNTKSKITGKIEPSEIDIEAFYFFTTNDPSWLKVNFVYEGVSLKGYVHKSRVKIIDKINF
jgi:hypothetical protein